MLQREKGSFHALIQDWKYNFTITFLNHAILSLKGQFSLKSKSSGSAIYSSRLFWGELLSFGDINCGALCLLSNIIKPDGTQRVELNASQNTIKKCIFQNHLVTQDNPQILL